ncbi:MAG: hypothetical protein H6657_16400 [Ardenticatenaceae bacterium]|nr:hypothetical protein [Ardenticatenaceae bacterium]
MWRIAYFVAIAVVVIHGLIHLLGFVAYWPLAEIAELPYKNTLLNGRLILTNTGMRWFSLFWLLAAVGLVTAAVSLVLDRAWWLPLMLAAVAVSLIITVLDWNNAFRGAILSLVLLVPLLVVVGLRQQPRPFPTYPQISQPLNRVAFPADLPAPVARYFEKVLGDAVPVVETAVVTGHGQLRFNGITFPHRLRFTYDVNQGYRHYIESTIFGLPILKVNEHFLDGQARLELPVGVVENEPNIDMAANLGFWGEAIWFPPLYLTDPRVRWEAIDATTARLTVPFGDTEDSFTVFFDADTGLITRMEAMRYRDATDTEKILWQLTPLAWETYHGIQIPSRSSVTWADEGTPWLVIDLDDVAYNVEVQDYIRAVGP